MATPAYRSHGTSSYNSHAKSLTVTKPSGTAENDVLILSLTTMTDTHAQSAIQAITWPAGFTELKTIFNNSTTGKEIQISIAWKLAGAAEGVNYTVSWTNDLGCKLLAVAISGGYTVSAIDDSEVNKSTVAGTSVVTPTMLARNTNTLYVATAANWAGAVHTPASGITSRVTDSTSMWLGDGDITDYGYTGTKTHTTNASSSWCSGAILVASQQRILTEGLTDNFDDNSINTTRWATEVVGTGTIAESGGKIIITPQNSTLGTLYFYTNELYRLTGSSVYVQCTQVASNTCETGLGLWLSSGNNLGISKYGDGKLYYGYNLASVWTGASVTYDADVHKWWKIRESGGTIYFDYSTDGLSWTNLGSVANPFAVTSMEMDLFVSEYTSTATPGAAWFDNFNVVPYSKTCTTKARIGATQTKSCQTKARIRIVDITKTLTVKGRIERIEAKIITCKGRIQVNGVQNYLTSKGNIQAMVPRTATCKARIQKAGTKNLICKGNIKTAYSKECTTKARIKFTYTETLLTKARIERTETQNYLTSKSNIRVMLSRTVTCKGRIERVEGKDITCKGRIGIVGIEEVIQTKADIRATIEKSVSCKTRVLLSEGKWITCKGNIKNTINKNCITEGNVRHVYIETVISKGNIRNTLTKSCTTKGRIERVENHSVTTQARIEQSFGYLLTCKGRIERTRQYTISTKANIKVTQTFILSCKARIKIEAVSGGYITVKGNIKNILGIISTIKARIQREGDKWIIAKGDILLSTNKTLTTKANIRHIFIETCLVRGNIKTTETTSINANGNIQKIQVQQITTKGNISGCVPSKTILVSPINEQDVLIPVTFTWVIGQDCQDRNIHAEIQVDKTDITFNDLEIDRVTFRDTDFEYYNGATWVAYPQAGITSIYYGNEARITINLTSGTKYWRVRQGVM